MTKTEAKRLERQRNRDAGLVRIDLWGTPLQREQTKLYVAGKARIILIKGK
jgi:hypothetical protein